MTENQLTAQPLIPWEDFSAAVGVERMPIPDRLATFKNYTAYVNEYGKELDSKTPEEGKPAMRDWTAQQNDWATKEQESLLAGDYVPWQDVEKSPSFQNTTNSDRLRSFANYTNYFEDYADLKLRDTPEQDRPAMEEWQRSQREWLMGVMDQAVEQYTLGGKIFSMDPMEQIDFLRTKDQSIAAGFTEEEWKQTREQFEESMIPLLEKHMVLSGKTSGMFPEYKLPFEPEAQKEFWKNVLWNEPERSAVGVAVERLPMESLAGIISMASGFSDFLSRDVGGRNPGGSYVAGSGERRSDVVSQTLGRFSDFTREGVEKMREAYPQDPRFSSVKQAGVAGFAQAPGQIAPFLIPGIGAPLGFAGMYGQLNQESQQKAYQAELENRYKEAVVAGDIPIGASVSSWEKTLDPDVREDMRSKVAVQSALAAMPATALDFVTTRMLLGLQATPGSQAVAKWLSKFRAAKPGLGTAAKIGTDAILRVGAGTVAEVGQEGITNLNAATISGDYSLKNLSKGFKEAFVGGFFGESTMAVVGIESSIKEQNRFLWAKGVLSGSVDPNVDELLAALRQKMYVAEATETTADPEYRQAAKIWAAKQDEANWVLRSIGDPMSDSKSADRHVNRQRAIGNYRNNFATYLRDAGVLTPQEIGEQLAADLEPITANIKKLRDLHRDNPTVSAGLDVFEQNLKRSANEKAAAALSKAEEKLQEFIGSVDQDGEGRADFARMVISTKFPNSDFLFSPEFQDNAVVTDILNGIEQDLITDETNLAEWLQAPAAQTAPAAAPAATTPATQGLLTTGQRRDAVKEARANLKEASPEDKESFDELANDIEFWTVILNDKDSTEQDKAEAMERLPALDDALLELATNPNQVSSQSPNPNDQNQAANQTTVPTQEVSATGAAGEGAGAGVQTIRATNADGTQADYSQEDYAEESRGIVNALETGAMSPEEVLQNVESVRMEIEAAPELTPEQKAQWFAPFQNVPALVEQRARAARTPKQAQTQQAQTQQAPAPAAQSTEQITDEIGQAANSLTEDEFVKWAKDSGYAIGDSPTTARLVYRSRRTPEPTAPVAETPAASEQQQAPAEKTSVTEQPPPVRLNGVSGDVVRTETGETVFRSAIDGAETVLRVKESSIDKDPTALTAEDFESGDGTPLVSEADKQFSVLPQNDRPVRPFFRTQSQNTEGGETPNEIQTQSLREGQSGSGLEGQSGSQGQTSPQGQSQVTSPQGAGATPAPAAAPDIAAITADVQANPDQHRSKQGNRKLISREAAIATLSQLPDTLTNKDVATLAKDSGMSSVNFRKLAALRGDQNAVGSILNGDMDAELGLFDRTTKVPLNETAPAVEETAPKTKSKVSNDTNTESTVVGQSSVDRWVNDSFTAIEQAAANLPQSSINAALFREKLSTEEGRAEIREKLGQMFNTVFRNLKISDPVVREEAMEKIFRGALQKQTGDGLTSNVLQDLLANLKKTGDPFLVKSKNGEVGYSAWLKHRNKQNEFMKAQGKRDMTETLVENEGAPTSASQGVQEEEGEGTGPAFTEGDPDIEAGKAEARSMIREATQRTYEKISREIAKQYGLDWETVRVAIAKHFEKTKGIKQDFDGLGWVVPHSAKIKKATAALEAAMPEIEKRLWSEMTIALKAASKEAEDLGLLKSDVVEISGTPTLEQLITLGIIDEIQNPDFYNAIKEAREKNSPDALVPLLAQFSQNDIASLQVVTGIVLNSGKPITNKEMLASLNKADMQEVLDSNLLPARLRQTLQTLVDLSGEDGLSLVRNSKNEGFRRLAELYTEQIGNRAPVEVVFNLGLNPAVTGQGFWTSGSNRVHISPFLTREKGLMEATILHEVMHPIWDRKITDFLDGRTDKLTENEQKTIAELQQLFNLAKAEADTRLGSITDPAERKRMERDLLGTRDLREFLNEALNHRPFQDFLNGIKDPNAAGKTSVWRSILNKILELIRGGKVSLDSVLQRSFELSVDLANYTEREMPIEQRNPKQIDYFRQLERQKGRPLTPREAELAAVDFALQYPQPRIAETREEANRLAGEILSEGELANYNHELRTEGQSVLASEMVVTDQQVFEALKANGGITVDVWTAGQPGTGVVVAPFKETETKIPLNEFKPDDVRSFLRKFRPLLEVPGMHLGGWISDDTVYLDVSIVTEDEVTATLLAKDGNQLAAYNIATGEYPSTPELASRNSGALAERRSDPDFQNLARTLQQAFGRAMGGLRGESNPNVPAEGAFPEIGIIEALTGEPATQDEINRIAESAAVAGRGNAVSPTTEGVGPESGSTPVPRPAVRPNAEPNPFVKSGIRGYNSKYGLTPAIEGHYAPISEQLSRDIAAAFIALPLVDNSPETREAYAQLEVEIQQQWDYAINEMGLTFEPWTQEGQPYASSREMVRDVRDNKHLWFFTGGEPHPFLDVRRPDGLTGTEKLRAVHDLFGHAAEDFQFGPRGEENAWIKHGQMFSPLAQRAMTTETRGANSWVNYGPQNYNEDGTRKNIPPQDRPYAEQKVALLPEEFMDWKAALASEGILQSRAVPELNEKFSGYTQVINYIESEYSPKAKALKSWINDSVDARLAIYNVVGRHGTHYIEYNPLGMLKQTRREVDFIMREEMIHAASGLVLMRKGIEWNDFYKDLAGSLSTKQRDNLKAVYTAEDEISAGAEFFRASIQKLLYGNITEAERKSRPISRIIGLLMDFIDYYRKGQVDPIVQDVYEDTVRLIQKIDKQNAKQDPNLAVLNSEAVENDAQFTPMPMSAIDVLYRDSSVLPKSPKKIKNAAVAAILEEVALSHWGSQLNSENITPEIEQVLVTNGVNEFISALQASGKNAGDWYSTAIEVAMGVAGVIHPEISDAALAKSIPAFASAKEPDKAAQLVMRIALAVTSQNLNVNQNAGYAEEQYAIFSSTGRFDSSKIYGEKATSISGNLELANQLVSMLGFEGAETFIKEEFSIATLQKKASAILGRSIKISGKLDDIVNGAALFGPKIGQGFLQNLMGRFDPVTIDLWLRRTWGRWTGDVVGDGVTEERMARLLDAARDAGLPIPEALQSLRTVERKRKNKKPFRTMSEAVSERLENEPEFRQSIIDLAAAFNSKGQAEYRISGQPVTPKVAALITKYLTPEWAQAQETAYRAAVERGDTDAAEAIQRDTPEKAYRQFIRGQQRIKDGLNKKWDDLRKAGKKPAMPKADWVAEQHKEAGRTVELENKLKGSLKPEWSRSAKVILTDLNPIDIPSPQDRRVITRIVNKIREELSNKGYTATNADVQAVLWYPEKDIWAKLRGEEESNLKLSYDDEFITIAEERGLGEQARAVAERIRADRAARTSGQNDARANEATDQGADGFQTSETLASAPVPFQGNVLPGFNPSVSTRADARKTSALAAVLSDPEYRSVQAALYNKSYFASREGETLKKADEFIDANGGDLQKAFINTSTAYGLTPEQAIVVRGLALKRAQAAANAARAELANPSTPANRKVNLQFVEQHYGDMAEDFAENLMENASLTGQGLRAYGLLSDALAPKTWANSYKKAAQKTQTEKFTKDPVLKEMMKRIKAARQKAAESTTVRMEKALAMAAKRFLSEGTTKDEFDAHEKFARMMSSELSVRDEIMQAAVEQTVVSGIETIRRAVAPGETIPDSFLREWENRLRKIATDQINAVIEQRLQGGQVDPEARELSEQEKEAERKQKLLDMWREFSDYPLAEIVFNLARSTVVASDSPYASLVRKAQFDPERIKNLRKAVQASINTTAEVRKSVADRRMSVEALKLRLAEANPSLTEAQLGRLAAAVEAVYNEEVARATRAAMDKLVREYSDRLFTKKTANTVGQPDFLQRLLPMVNMGVFSDEAVYNAVADKLRLPVWNPDTAAEIEAKANELQALPEGSIQRQEAAQRLMSDILKANIKEARGAKRWGPLLQISSALWSAGILSGPPTQIINTGMTTVSVFAQNIFEATGYWAAATANGATQEQARAYYGDMLRAWLFAAGKDANNTSLRAVNEVHNALTKGQTRFKSEKLENMSPLELFKFHPRVATPGNKMMDALISGEGKTALKEAVKMAAGVPVTMAQRTATADVKGAVKDYIATMKLVGRLMLAADGVNSYAAMASKEMMMRRYLAQKEKMSPQEIDRVMREAQQGGNEAVRDAAIAQAEDEAQRGDFGPTGTASHEVQKARRIEQLIEQQTYDSDTINAGREFAAVATFNNDPYGAIGWMMDTLFAGPTKILGIATKPINPFPKTVSNLVNAAIDFSPYGVLRAEGLNLGTALAQSKHYPKQFYKEAPERGTPEYYALYSRAAFGTAATGILAMMIVSAVKDRKEKKEEPWFEIHGAGPRGPEARKQWAASGAKKFSLKVGKGDGALQLNYTDWPVLNLVLGVLGTFYDEAVYGDLQTDPWDWLTQTLRSVALVTLNRNFLGGAANLFEILSVNTPEALASVKMKQFFSSYPTGFTRPSFVRWAETIATGTRQETSTPEGWLLSMTPVVSAFRDRPALNLLGEPIEISAWDATAGRVATLQKTHPILTPLTNAQLWINPPKAYPIHDPNSPTLVRKITKTEFYDYGKAYGEALKTMLPPQQVSALAELSKTAPNTAQEILNNLANIASNIAKAELAGRGKIKGKELKGP